MPLSFMKIPNDFLDQVINLSDEDKGQLLLGMLRYISKETEPQLTNGAYCIWPIMKRMLDRQKQVYEKKVANGSKGGRPRKNT